MWFRRWLTKIRHHELWFTRWWVDVYCRRGCFHLWSFWRCSSSAGLVTDQGANFFLEGSSPLLRILDIRFWCSFDALWQLFKLSLSLCPLNCLTNVGDTSLSSRREIHVFYTEWLKTFPVEVSKPMTDLAFINISPILILPQRVG